MERLRRIVNRLLFPGAAVVILSIPVAAVLLVYIFVFGHQEEPVSYLAYALSAYALTIVCAAVPRIVRGGSALVHKNPYIHRYLTDLPFRTRVSLYLSLTVNVLYAAGNLPPAFIPILFWFGAVAVYYMLLAVMRFLLLRHVNKNTMGQNREWELRRYRFCGVLLLMMNVALASIVVFIVHQNRGYVYPGFLIYAMAAYAFYTVTTAIIHVVKCRKQNSPVLSAAKAINLAAALVSMLALETAMLTQFGDAGDSAFRRIMTSATGTAVCVIVLAMAVFMIVHSTKQLRGKRP